MTIFFITNDLWNLINFRKPLLQKLKKEGYKIIIITNLNKKKYFLKDKNLILHHVNFQSNFNFFNDLINILNILLLYLKYKPKISLNFTIKPILLSSLISKFLNIKCINTVTGFGNLYLKSKISKFIFMKFYKLFTSKKNYFFFHNKEDCNLFLKNKICKKKNTFITMGSGVNLNKFKYLKPNYKKKINFLMVSRFIYNKGVIEFFKAVELLKNKKNLHFEIIGRDNNDQYNEIKKTEISQFKVLKNLKISNYTKNIDKKFKNTHFTILPTYREGMPKSLLEAMSSGIPVIASKVPGCSELIKENFNGFFCIPKDYVSLYKVILKASKIDKKRYNLISKNCRKYAENYLDEKKVILKYFSLIEKII